MRSVRCHPMPLLRIRILVRKGQGRPQGGRRRGFEGHRGRGAYDIQEVVSKNASGSVPNPSPAATGQGSWSKLADPSALPWLAPPGSTAQAASPAVAGQARRRRSSKVGGEQPKGTASDRAGTRSAKPGRWALQANADAYKAKAVLHNPAGPFGVPSLSHWRPFAHQLCVSALVRVCQAPGGGAAERRGG